MTQEQRIANLELQVKSLMYALGRVRNEIAMIEHLIGKQDLPSGVGRSLRNIGVHLKTL